MRFRLVLLLLAWALLSPKGYAGEYAHPKLKSKEKTVRSLVVLPVKAEVTKSGVKGAEPMMQESQELTVQLASAIAEALKGEGFDVLENAFSEEAINGNPELQGMLTEFQTRYDTLAPQLYKKPKDVTKGRFSLGDEVTDLKVSDSVEALIILRASAVETTKAKGFLSGGLGGLIRSGRSTEYYLTVVDSHSGEILFFANGTAGDDVKKGISKSLRKLPH
ncbi:MAG: hypothetical protein HY313_02695 [Acidobacteria bacterium]|nr:hypothetical protein [Acidobacteriota bacterium]